MTALKTVLSSGSLLKLWLNLLSKSKWVYRPREVAKSVTEIKRMSKIDLEVLYKQVNDIRRNRLLFIGIFNTNIKNLTNFQAERPSLATAASRPFWDTIEWNDNRE